MCQELSEALKDLPTPDFVLLVSSLAAHIGGMGHAGYATANAWLDAFARAQSKPGHPRWISVNSELWDAPGLTPEGESGLGHSLKDLALSHDDGVRTLLEAVQRAVPEISVSSNDLNAREHQWPGVISQPAPGTEPPKTHSGNVTSSDVSPADPIQQVASIWGEVLGYDAIEPDQDFFALGGHSVAAVKIVSRMRNELGLAITVPEMMRTPTIGALMDFLEEKDRIKRNRIAELLEQVEALQTTERDAS